MQRKFSLALSYVEIWGCLAYGTLLVCVSSIFVFLTQAQHYMMVYTHIKSYISTRGAKSADILRLDLGYYATSCRLASLLIV